MNEEAVYKLEIDCGRSGDLNGLFIAKKSHVNKLTESGIKVYFGEVLGKHSEVFGSIKKEEITLVTDDPQVVKIFKEFKLNSGHNPFNYTAIQVDEKYEDWPAGEIVEDMLKQD